MTVATTTSPPATTTAAAKAKSAGSALATTAGRTPGPARAAGLAAAGLAGGLVLGARLAGHRRFLPGPRRRVLGVPVGRRPASVAAAKAFADGARRLADAAGQLSSSADDVHQIREQLELSNRRSPVEIVLDGLTHRRGAHKAEH